MYNIQYILKFAQSLVMYTKIMIKLLIMILVLLMILGCLSSPIFHEHWLANKILIVEVSPPVSAT